MIEHERFRMKTFAAKELKQNEEISQDCRKKAILAKNLVVNNFPIKEGSIARLLD
ncbi:MAG: hypothetical protein KJ725_06590 [Gammaproteobacteria bacterium]|nr:hypothetical protein [Gammaproteobacteria bacterium]